MPPARPQDVAEASPPLWPKPALTANAGLLTGYLGGLIDRNRNEEGGMYRVHQLLPQLILEDENGNLFRVAVEQIAGTE